MQYGTNWSISKGCILRSLRDTDRGLVDAVDRTFYHTIMINQNRNFKQEDRDGTKFSVHNVFY
jgi:hypothetical protein